MRRLGVRVEPLPWNVQRPDERCSESPLSRGARDLDGDTDAALCFFRRAAFADSIRRNGYNSGI
jgi:hypothetical protein